MKKPDKTKGTAIMLALLFSFWTWIYTYERDYQKFWIGLVVSIIGIFFLSILGIAVWIAVWVVAVADSIQKDDKKLAKYYSLKY